jgi:citrate lyase subunit beta / citryl-CoA lyase
MTPAPRSYLFVPGHRPDRFDKARASGADLAVLDLEDAVAPQDKPAARAAIGNWLDEARPCALRINAAGTDGFAADLDLCRSLRGLAAVLLPKAERAQDIAAVAAAAPGAAIVAIVETATGMAAARTLAASRGVQRLAFGTLDFAVDLGLAVDEQGTQDELAAFRSELVLASRLAGIAAPVDGVTTALDDDARLAADTLRARRFGFGAKLCIHPKQVAVVHRSFAPLDEQVAWAERVLAAIAASGGAAVQVDGRMVDRPVVLQAEAVLAAARR